jgi:hypothetical protein
MITLRSTFALLLSVAAVASAFAQAPGSSDYPAPAPAAAPGLSPAAPAAPVAAPGLSSAVPAPPAARAPVPPAVANVLATMADENPDARFKGKMGGTFGKDVTEVLPAGKRVAVVGFRVAFITDNKITAQVRSAYLPGMDFSGARSSFFVELKGVDGATLQNVTDRAYKDLVALIAASGREVVPVEQLMEHFSGLKTSPRGYVKEQNGQTANFFTPSGTPLFFTHFEAQWGDSGLFDISNYRKLQEISSKLNAVVIAPVVFVNFARMSSSGNRSGLLASTAETGGEMAMSVAGFSTLYIRTEEFRNGMLMKGDEGSIQMNGAIASPLEFGKMQVTSQEDNRALRTTLNVVGMLSGLGGNLGGAARSSTKAVAETTNDAYAAAANDALLRMSATLGKWFSKYPPAP